jgi:hypothetical protein
MVNSSDQYLGAHRMNARHCIDPLVGDILAGWRYDISGLSPAMRTDYDRHLVECVHCRHRQRLARTIDFLLLAVSSLSILAFLLAAAVLHRIEAIAHLGSSLHGHLHNTPITISLEAAAIAGLLVAVSTPIPTLVSEAVQQRIPQHIRERISKNAA